MLEIVLLEHAKGVLKADGAEEREGAKKAPVRARMEGIGAYVNPLRGVSFSWSSIGELGLGDEISEASLDAIMELCIDRCYPRG